MDVGKGKKGRVVLTLNKVVLPCRVTRVSHKRTWDLALR